MHAVATLAAHPAITLNSLRVIMSSVNVRMYIMSQSNSGKNTVNYSRV